MTSQSKFAGYRFVASRMLKKGLQNARRALKDGAASGGVATTPASQCAAGTYHSIYPPEDFTLIRPPNFSNDDWRAFQIRNVRSIPESFVVDLRNASVVGVDGWVRDSADTFVDDIWSEFGCSTSTMAPKHIAASNSVQLGGTSVCLAMPWMPNYYHWTLQTVPRVHLLSCIMNPQEVDHWIVTGRMSSYMRDWLDILHVPEAKCIFTIDGALSCERLIVPSIPAPNRWIPAWVVQYVKNRTTDLAQPIVSGRRIYVTRDSGEKRRVLNQTELDAVISRAGLEVISMSGLSVRQQVALFASAELIVSVLGAALTNLVYCRTGTKVIEILPKNLTFPAYYKLAQAVGLDYYSILGLEPRVPAPFYTTDPSADVLVNVAILEKLLGRLEAAPSLTGL